MPKFLRFFFFLSISAFVALVGLTVLVNETQAQTCSGYFQYPLTCKVSTTGDCVGATFGSDACGWDGSQCVGNQRNYICGWSGGVCKVLGDGAVQKTLCGGTATPPPGNSPTPGICTQTCEQVTQCQRIDNNCHGNWGSGCGTATDGTPKKYCTEQKCITACPTQTSTPTPSISAYCQSISAYTTSWSPMSLTQLQSMTGGQKLYYCANGSASSGVFSKARFTINKVLMPETTLKRTNSNDFCQLYSIPTNTYSFSVIAEMYHSTLGWVR